MIFARAASFDGLEKTIVNQQYPSPLRIGTRGSALALAQTKWVRERIRALAGADFPVEIVEIHTSGDRDRVRGLREIGGTGLFTRELENALLEDRIHLAVHSLKDLPIRQPEGLVILAIPERAPATDVLISRTGSSLENLPKGACIGTGSLRRQAQVLALRPDLNVRPIRGNVDTRLRKMREGEYDAILLARAGLERLGREGEITQDLPIESVLPAPGQGALAIEGKPLWERVLTDLNHPETAAAVRAEREVLAGLGGGCHLPLAAFAEKSEAGLRLRARLSAPDGSKHVEAEGTGPLEKTDEIVAKVLDGLRSRGAEEILAGIE